MKETGKFQRILQMILVLKNKYGVTKSAFAEKFDISERTVYRYFCAFNESGFLIENTGGYYRFKRDTKEYHDLSELLHFSREESYILQQAIHSIDTTNVLKENLIKKLYSLYNSREVSETIVRDQLGLNIHNICESIERKKIVLFKDYKSANSSRINSRKVEPFEFTSNYISIWCFDIDKKENRLFKTARIGEAIIQEEPWRNENRHRAIETDVFRISMPEKTGVKIQLSLRAYNLMVEEYPLSEKWITKNGNHYIFDGYVGNFNGIGRFIMGLIDEVKVIGPQELKDFLNIKIEERRF